MVSLNEICSQAMVEGRKIDLSDCVYGEAHWEGPFVNYPMMHYYFIAGFVKTQSFRNMIDLGTHYGGSVMAMAKGAVHSDIQKLKIATVDITFKNEEGFNKYPHIKRVKGDSLSRETINELIGFFNCPIDLLFIDTDHKGPILLRNIEVFVKYFLPKYILIDDVHLNSSMENAWKRIVSEFKDKAFDASVILDRKAGFGVVHCSYPSRLRMQPDLRIKYLLLKIKHSVAEYVRKIFN